MNQDNENGCGDISAAAVLCRLTDEEFLDVLLQMLRVDVVVDDELQVSLDGAKHEAQQRFGIGITGLAVYPDVKGVFFSDFIQFLSIF
jgi:hypothetical protein